MNTSNSFVRKGKLFVAGTVVAVALAATAIVALAPAAKVSAASCDQVNIIHCGLDSSTINGYIDSFKSFYNQNNDNGHTDLQTVYNWAGLSADDVKNMSADNTKVGTLTRNGEVTVDGKVVATDAWVSARFTNGDGFVKVSDGVWARKTTTSFANDSVKVLVHYDGNTVDSVVMIDCGNAVKVTPVKPTPVLKCVKVTSARVGDTLTYNFTAEASAVNTKILSYTFHYSDGTTKTVRSSDTKATDTHSFTEFNKKYTLTVTVNDYNTSSACSAEVTTPQAPAKSLVCQSLTKNVVAGKDLTYTFTATAAATNTTISSYVFDFGDATAKQTINSSATTVTSEAHTFPLNKETYVVKVTVNSKDGSTVPASTCTVTLTTPEKPCVPTSTQNSNCVEKPKELTNAGPGAVFGLFAGTSTIGAVAHQIVRRRIRR